MLKAIRRVGLRLKLEFSFIKHERSAYRRHLEEADSRFDIAALELKIERSENAVEKEVNAEFGLKVSAANAKESQSLSALRRAEEDECLLQRDYKAELDPLYDQIAQLQQDLSEAYQEKSDAYARLSAAKSSLNSWYAKSDRTFFGNKGKQLPKHAIFGQDLSDRDYYKRQRDSAASDLGDAKSEIERLKSRKSEIGVQIGSIKQERSRMYELRDRGLNRKAAAENVATCRNAVSAAMLEKQCIQSARISYEADSLKKHRLPELRKQLFAMNADRAAFVKKFAAPDEKARRRREFEDVFNQQHPT